MTVELTKRSDPNALALQFTRLDDLTPEEQATVKEIGRRGHVIVRERQRDVGNLGWLKAMQVVGQVKNAIPYRFTSNMFVRAYKNEKVRPANGSSHPSERKRSTATTTSHTATTSTARRTWLI